ncbi:MAG: DNA polymerase I [Candidatus Wallbacteria bacterium]|nr:DNA polymerase I [Candidatus Wallbacteria bacterium]
MSRVFLIDGYSLLYRAHYALINSPLITSKGFNTSGLFGFINMLFTLFEREQPEYVAVAFDKGEKTFRNDLYPEYKGTRQKTPDELIAQFPYARDIVRAMNLPAVEIEGYEADDLLGSLARRFSGQGLDVVIVTGDRDSLQLVTPNVKVLMTKRGVSETVLYDPERVQLDFGVTPEQFVDLKALQGDTSDNIPGVPSVGPKTAAKLIADHGSLDGVYANLDKVKGKLRENLENNRHLAYLSRDLARIRSELEYPLALEACRPGTYDREALRRLFLELELRKLASLISPGETGPQPAAADYRTVLAEADFAELLEALGRAQTLSLDTETTSVSPMRAELVGISLATEEGRAHYIPLAHRYLGAPEQLERAAVLERLRPLLTDPAKRIVGQNLKYDVIVLARHGLDIAPPAFDTMVASYVLDPTRLQHNMDGLALEHLGVKSLPYSEVVPKDRTFDTVDVALATRYSGEDADLALRLTRVLGAKLEESGLTKLFADVEMPLVPVLARMERNGIAIDSDYLRDLSKEMLVEIRQLESTIHGLAGEEFNVNSPQQLSRILFEKMGLPVIRKTKTGTSTDAAVLEELEKAHGSEIAAYINRYRHLVKLRGTYVEALPLLVHPETGRIHSSFGQVVAATGRLSSSDPNLQNIPVRTEIGNRIRKAFRPQPPDWLFVGADYSQIELRILAHVTQSQVLMKAFAEGGDIHTETASLIFGVPAAQVDAPMRNRAKGINFGIIYGMGAFGLANRLDITQSEAKAFIDSYFERLPEVKTFIDSTVARARKDGFVTTLLARRRELPEIRSSNANLRGFAERTAVNTPIQGTAADLIKLAMIRLDAEMRSRGMRSRLLLQIHDELVCESPPDELETMSECLKRVMEGALALSVPLVANVRTGADWSQLK